MDINQEKKYIYSIMKEVTEERRSLTEIYYRLKERLDKLHELEQRGLTNLDLKGYVDLHNELSKKNIVDNIKRESNKIVKDIEKEYNNSDDTNDKVVKPIDVTASRKPSFELLKSMITNVLRESNTEMNLDEILECVNNKLKGEYHLTRKNLSSNILYRIFKDNDRKIQRVGHGIYKYEI